MQLHFFFFQEGPFLYLRDPQTIYAYNYSVVEYMTSNYTTTDCTEVIYLPVRKIGKNVLLISGRYFDYNSPGGW